MRSQSAPQRRQSVLEGRVDVSAEPEGVREYLLDPDGITVEITLETPERFSRFVLDAEMPYALDINGNRSSTTTSSRSTSCSDASPPGASPTATPPVPGGTSFYAATEIDVRIPGIGPLLNQIIRPIVFSRATADHWIRHNIEETGRTEDILPAIYAHATATDRSA